MRIGLYNRHLATLGGGERYSLAIAALLSHRNPVEVISHVPVDPAAVQQRLQMDLGQVRWRVVPEHAPAALASLSADYDFFINGSNLDFIPNRAAHAAMVVYFPLPADGGLNAGLRRYTSTFLREWFMLPVFRAGVYGEEAGGARRLAPHAVIEMPVAPAPYRVHFLLRSALDAVQEVRVAVDGVEQVRVTVDGRFTPCTLLMDPSRDQATHTITVDTAAITPSARFALHLAGWEADQARNYLYRRWFVRRLPAWDARLRNPQPADIVAVARTYPIIWGISNYTRQWIARYWGLTSSLLYPPVDVTRFVPSPDKRLQILSVGRFFTGQHNKKHVVMIDAFKQLVDQGLRGWELHLAGGVNHGAEHAGYLAQVQAAARGYPIHLHPDLPFDELAILYGESALYWHAAGFGEDEIRQPFKAEHFGITTVEAMAAGCVPVVIARGGQPELIRHGVDGYLWQTIAELLAYTRQLVGDVALRQTLAAAAHASSRRFGLPEFATTLAGTLAAAGISQEGG